MRRSLVRSQQDCRVCDCVRKAPCSKAARQEQCTQCDPSLQQHSVSPRVVLDLLRRVAEGIASRKISIAFASLPRSRRHSSHTHATVCPMMPDSSREGSPRDKILTKIHQYPGNLTTPPFTLPAPGDPIPRFAPANPANLRGSLKESCACPTSQTTQAYKPQGVSNESSYPSPLPISHSPPHRPCRRGLSARQGEGDGPAAP